MAAYVLGVYVMMCNTNVLSQLDGTKPVGGVNVLALEKEKVEVAFKDRLKLAENINYTVKQNSWTAEYDGDKIGNERSRTFDETFVSTVVGHSYKTKSERRDWKSGQLLQIVVDFYDSNEGVNKGLLTFSNGVTAGKIDTQQDRLLHENRYMYWLNGKHTNLAEYIIAYAIESISSWKIEADGSDRIILEMDWKPRWSKISLGKRTYLLDAKRGYMPIMGHGRWSRLRSDGKTEWRSERFLVLESHVFNNLHMPTKIQEIVSSSNHPARTATVYDLEIEKLEMGKVTVNNLELSFPEGILVVDTIKGIRYKTGINGDQLDTVRLIGSISPSMSHEKQRPPYESRHVRNILLVIVVITGMVILCVVYYKMRRL